MSQLPAFLKPTITVEPFTVAIPDQDITEFKTLLKLSKLPPPTFEGQHRNFGVTSAWMRDAKAKWEKDYDWRATETKINSLPHFTAVVQDLRIHFVGMFSEDPNAIPLVLLHGWPGSFYEYHLLVKELRKSTSPSFHIIVPSLPGYTFSSPPPLDRDFGLASVVQIMDELITGLGLGDYIAVGGDIGAAVAMGLSSLPECRGVHLNMLFTKSQPEAQPEASLPPHELAGLERAKAWVETGRAYAIEHATRPSTIAHALASSPLALLAWLAEKFLDWTDEDPSVEHILEMASLWWFTETFPTSIYPYRELMRRRDDHDWCAIRKPFGYSWFPKELRPPPRSLVEAEGTLVYFNHHEKGGHFPGFENPAAYAGDIIAYVKELGKQAA